MTDESVCLSITFKPAASVFYVTTKSCRGDANEHAHDARAQPNSSDSDKAALASLEQMSSNKEAATLLDRPPSRAQVLDPASVTAVKTIAERSGSSAEAIAAMLSLDVEAVKAALASLSLDERTRNMIHTVAARSGLSAEAIATSMQLDVVAVQATLAGPAPPQSDVDAVTEPEPVKATAGNDNVDERRRRIHAAAAARAAATLARLSPQPPLPTKSDSDLARELQRQQPPLPTKSDSDLARELQSMFADELQEQELRRQRDAAAAEEALRVAEAADAAEAMQQALRVAQEQELQRRRDAAAAEEALRVAEAADAAEAMAAAEAAARAEARAQAERQRPLWEQLAKGIETEDKLRAFFERRQDTRNCGHQKLRITASVKIDNEGLLQRFKHTGNAPNLNPKDAYNKSGETFLFHGSPEQLNPNIQAEGLKMSFAGTSHGTMLGNGIYGAPDPRKSLQYCANPQHGMFMFVCRFNLLKRVDKYAQNNVFDEYCIFDDRRVVVLWMIKVE